MSTAARLAQRGIVGLNVSRWEALVDWEEADYAFLYAASHCVECPSYLGAEQLDGGEDADADISAIRPYSIEVWPD
jgi:hypothetical protein